ncbi:hypothetical protein [Chryseobacterium vrystaatense]|uniref:Uncharacterized protein n=1 Tax=Chryseobacterium vrystaatense TaxID=307480 RepID=A0A1M5DX55_9FLAO|nr:hypothetical protein [Chryseobacterium vrystaatense]SHF71421.1 hypothetical protein SAMN02787073_2741 [Chryseobacterium vrystaatense]
MKDIQDSYCIAVADHIKKFIDDNKIDLADLAAAANEKLLKHKVRNIKIVSYKFNFSK